MHLHEVHYMYALGAHLAAFRVFPTQKLDSVTPHKHLPGLIVHLSILVSALVGPDLVFPAIHGATEQASAAVASALEEQALLVVCGRCVARVHDGSVHRLLLVPPARISRATQGQVPSRRPLRTSGNSAGPSACRGEFWRWLRTQCPGR